MRITIELRRPARRSVALIVAALLLLTPAVVLASHQFSDVYNTTPFHKEIGAIAKAGITGGFAGNQYRPSEPVTRQAMAAFMERGFGRVGLAAGTPPNTASVDVAPGSSLSTYYMLVRELTITVPGASNAFSPNQLVHLQGRIMFDTAMNSAQGCPCEFIAIITDDAAAGAAGFQAQTFNTGASVALFHSFDVEALLPAPPGARTYRLYVALSWRVSNTSEATFMLDRGSSLSAETFPFGPTGGNTVTAPGAQNEPANADQLPERRRDE